MVTVHEDELERVRSLIWTWCTFDTEERQTILPLTMLLCSRGNMLVVELTITKQIAALCPAESCSMTQVGCGLSHHSHRQTLLNLAGVPHPKLSTGTEET